MPRILLDRCRPDCIAEFRLAAAQRFEEAEHLNLRGHRLSGIYLYGYVAEMMVKAAYFAFLGYGSRHPITMANLRAAASKAPSLGIPAFPNLHHIESWARLLIAERAVAGSTLSAGFSKKMVRAAQKVQRHWRETLRYHGNMAYSFEVIQVKEGTSWLLRNL